ncbi:MAG TPA: hypothetical protein VFX02_02740 [Gammaproteobacteria bacterium]|nr:hypothetical protein [Gammaproteobacteria bacterium]
MLYEDSYIGNFTLYYTPDVVDPSKVLVPQVTCYSADLDLDEASVKPYPVMRCSYYEVIRYYAGQPEYFYEIAGGGVNRLLAYRVALAWYTRSDKGAHIKTISWKKGALSIFSSGGACSTGETVEFGPNQEIIFKEQDVVICS